MPDAEVISMRRVPDAERVEHLKAQVLDLSAENSDLRSEAAGRPAMVPVGYWWRHLAGSWVKDGDDWVFTPGAFSTWNFVQTRSEIPTELSGIEVQTLFAMGPPSA